MSSPPSTDRPAIPASAADRSSIGGPRAWWSGLAPRRRRVLQAVLAIGVILVVVVGALLGRFLSTENTERNDEAALIAAEARGDVTGMLALLSGCRQSPSCVALVRANAGNSRLRRAGAVKILSLKSSTAYALSSSSGKTRIAWTVIGELPVVQCVEVRRTGNFLRGITISLLSLSAPIPNEADC
ncbi:MAG TPA: hypothetical protein VNY35_04240 [Solirubrobacteraceae bacterium]|nr:hypothetical protein [Solirubrobacteraceae bacterium]